PSTTPTATASAPPTPCRCPSPLITSTRRAPARAVPQRIAQVDDERLEVVGEATSSGGIAGSLELVDEGLEPRFAVALVLGLVERLPVGPAHPLAILLGQLRDQVPGAVNGAVLAVRGRPALLDRLDQAGGAVGDDEHRRPKAACDQVPCEAEPVLVRLAHPERDADEDPIA